MAAAPARQRWMVVLYMFVAIPLIIVLLFFLNPSFSATATKYVKNIAGLSDAQQPAQELPVLDESHGPVLPDIPSLPQPEGQPEAPAAEESHGPVKPDVPADPPKEEQPPADPKGDKQQPEKAVEPQESHGPVRPDVPANPQQQTVPTTLSAALATPARSEALSAASRISSEKEASATPNPAENGESGSPTSAADSAASSDPAWNEEKWWFQGDLEDKEYPLPKFDIEKLRYRAPHNFNGPGHETFATYYATRNATLRDPYFLSALAIVYRVLWAEKSKSQHTMTVFVPPFISDEQRQYFSAAGAIVRELSLVPFVPDGQTIGRWKDQFSKLEMWRQTDFSRIVYLDSDVFPMNNTDGIFADAPEQRCNPDQLSVPDRQFAAQICDYVFSAAYQFEQEWTLNAGVMVFKPDVAIYDHLIRGMKEKKGWDTKMMEQGMLNYIFRKDGPFPIHLLEAKWNAAPTWGEDGKGSGFHYIHDKMWAHYFPPGDWVLQEYRQTWADMIKLYESEEFVEMRGADQDRAMANIKPARVDAVGNKS